MSEQAVRAWIALLRGHATVVRTLNAQLVGEHGLTINDYEVLLRLVSAPERSMRRVDLAESVLLTPSGITRLLDGLERAGYVERGACSSDRRVTYAVLTDVGREKLEEARSSHLADIQAFFAKHFSDEELRTLGQLLSRLPTDDSDAGC